MAPPKRTLESRILGHLSRGPLRRWELRLKMQVRPVARLDAALAPLIEAGTITEGARQSRKGRAAKVYSLAGNTETQP